MWWQSPSIPSAPWKIRLNDRPARRIRNSFDHKGHEAQQEQSFGELLRAPRALRGCQKSFICSAVTSLVFVRLFRFFIHERPHPMFNTVFVVTAAAALLLTVAFRHHRHRQRVYRALAARRKEIIRRNRPAIATILDPRALRGEFERERIIRVERFLAPASLARIQEECRNNQKRAERSYLPMHKKGGTLSYENIQRHAPACLALYHAPELHQWLSAVVGEPLQATADHDQSSCSLLYYDEAGDHINWHRDHNFYRGRHFTILIALANRAESGGVSSGRLMRKRADGEVVSVDTAENVLVIFEGASVAHRASRVEHGDERVMLSMTLCTDPRIGWLREVARRIKDTAYFGPRILVD